MLLRTIPASGPPGGDSPRAVFIAASGRLGTVNAVPGSAWPSPHLLTEGILPKKSALAGAKLAYGGRSEKARRRKFIMFYFPHYGKYYKKFSRKGIWKLFDEKASHSITIPASVSSAAAIPSLAYCLVAHESSCLGSSLPIGVQALKRPRSQRWGSESRRSSDRWLYTVSG